ncbi:hypothetical protein RBSWK_05743 [Rhodopirellula baltica SWK14]|uniref:Uncharacterized protein n=1 Tax=Rhodopirellula baltica SWK14 TaxID=993516 RepID=L7C9I9_RHOBT|nr:hypothetical protein RBSWK_05743 [Rhodopirellula baltica SWK14]
MPPVPSIETTDPLDPDGLENLIFKCEAMEGSANKKSVVVAA